MNAEYKTLRGQPYVSTPLPCLPSNHIGSHLLLAPFQNPVLTEGHGTDVLVSHLILRSSSAKISLDFVCTVAHFISQSS